jgi:toxin YoeB
VNVTFTDDSWQEYLDWQTTDKKVLKKINALIKDIKRDPFDGIGKPEALKHELSGCWSRRITNEHRIVYEVSSCCIAIISCKYHY